MINVVGNHLIRRFVDGLGAMFIVVDRQYRLKEFNRKFAEWAEASCGMVAKVGDNLFAFRIESDPENIRERIDRAFTGQSETEEGRTTGKNGPVSYFEVSYYPVETDEGTIEGVAILALDITERKKTENDLLKSEERLLMTLQTARLGMWEWNVEKDVWYASPSYYTMLGYEPKSGPADQNEWFERVHPDDRRLVREKIQEAKTRNTQAHEYEARIRHADGTYRWQRVTGFEVERGADGKVKRMLGIRKDIDDRKEAETALALNERRLVSIFDDSPISIWEEDFSALKTRLEEARAGGVTDWREYFSPRVRVEEYASLLKVVDVNKATVKLLECADKAEALRKLPDFFDQSSVDTFRDELVSLAEGNGSFECESMLNTAKGTRVFLQLRLNVVPGHENDWSRVLVSLVDLSARKAAEEALEKSEVKFRGLVEQSSEGIVLIDGSGTVLECNPVLCRLFDITKERLIGKSVGDIGRGMFPDDFWDVAKELRNGAPTMTRETIALHESGVRRVIEQTFFPIFMQETVLIGGIMRDVTEQRAASEAIMSSLREKELLLSEIHHRVKNNLQIICSLVNLQLNKTEGDSAEKRSLLDMEARIRSMSLVHELLYQSDEFASVDFSSYIGQLCDFLLDTYTAGKNRIRIITQVDSVSLPLDKAIPCGLIINELVVNALKHAFPDGRKGTVRIALTMAGERAARLTVSDDGIGFPVGQSASANNPSIGLVLVENLARQLHGHATGVNDGGYSYTVSFPL